MKKVTLPILLTIGTLTSYGQFTEVDNGTFENWHALTADTMPLEAPDLWCGTDSLIAAIAPTAAWAGIDIEAKQQLFEESMSHSGQAAAKVITEDLGDTLGVVPGGLVNAQLSFDMAAFAGSGDPSQIMDFLSFDGGTLIDDQVDTVSAWVNADPANTEDASVTAMAVITIQNSNGDDSMVVVGEGSLSIASTSGYEEIFVPLTYADPNVVPERLLVFFSSGDMEAPTATVGNSLLVDDVNYSLQGSSAIFPVTRDAKLVKVFPVPAKDQVNFELKGDFGAAALTVFDVQGRLIRTETVQAGAISRMQVTNWTKGTYYFRLEDTNSGLMDHGSFVIK